MFDVVVDVVMLLLMVMVMTYVDLLSHAILSLCPRSSGRFEDPWADEESVVGHPEKDVLSYLETCASALGLALDLEAKICALRTLSSVTLTDGGGGMAPPKATPTSGPASSSALGEFGGGSGKCSGVRSDGVAERGEGVKNKTATISSVQDVYASITTALSQALVHCKRFEVCGGEIQEGLHVGSTKGLLRSSYLDSSPLRFRSKVYHVPVCIAVLIPVKNHASGGCSGSWTTRSWAGG